MLYIRKAEASEVVGHETDQQGSIRMLTILFISGDKRGSRKVRSQEK